MNFYLAGLNIELQSHDYHKYVLTSNNLSS